jgi:hypothetical protein
MGTSSITGPKNVVVFFYNILLKQYLDIAKSLDLIHIEKAVVKYSDAYTLAGVAIGMEYIDSEALQLPGRQVVAFE